MPAPYKREMMQKIILWCILTILLMAEHNHTNALVNEDSPYLQQHAHNPVNWYPWGKEAFEKAKKENKLIFLSIGYSTCHWCHVMEEESFENESVAKLLNDSYIAIKVDREEYPQLDKKYQKWYMAVYGKRGGWPLTVFMSPRAEVFHLATYIPAEEGYGSKGMFNMLPAFIELSKKKPQEFQSLIQKHKTARSNMYIQKELRSKLTEDLVYTFMKNVKAQFDSTNGGFYKRPKFPEASKLMLLLDIYALYGNEEALQMAEFTLRKMAEGGIYDQIGGGFFRYTTDEAWHIPHFEKMLYTNAELIPVYVRLYAITKDPLYKKVVVETIAQIENNFMQQGLYLSASDADSAGEEGGYFIFNYEELKEALLKKGLKLKDVEAALVYLGIEEDGNIDGELSNPHITSQIVPKEIEKVKDYLKALSLKREFPFLDTKIITSWNAMMIKALFTASKIDEKYAALAEKRLSALLTLMRQKDILYHQVLLGQKPKQKALLEDYAFLMDTLIEGYLKTYNKHYLFLLKALAKETKEKFYKENRWYLSDDGIDALADFDDKYYTAALSLVLEDFVRVASLTEALEYNEIVKNTLKAEGAVLEKSPQDASRLLHTFLHLKKGDVIIKSKLDNLLASKDEIAKIKYPFVLSKTEETNKYLACRVNSCFAYDKNITALIEKINKMVK
jgi:uncharacterized protein YyaL (SSP411 family)